MQLMIDEGRWVVTSDDAHVHIVIDPRRSLSGNATRMRLRAEPMPLLELDPEGMAPSVPAMAWVWNGTPEQAQAIVLKLLPALRSHLSPNESHPEKVRQWRMSVLASLFKDKAAVEEGRSRRA